MYCDNGVESIGTDIQSRAVWGQHCTIDPVKAVIIAQIKEISNPYLKIIQLTSIY